MHALAIVWAAATALVLPALSVSMWSQHKGPAIVLIPLAVALQASLAYYALGSDGVSQLLRLLGITA